MNSDSFLMREVRGASDSTVFFPGWATDFRVFDNLDLPTNRLLPLDPFSRGLPDELAAHIRAKGLGCVTLIGWSLGGFVGVDFARRFPELVSRLILCGVRQRYPADQIEAMRRGILDDKERALASFYRQCFLPARKKDYQWFRDELAPHYFKEMSIGHLVESLDCLAQAGISPESLPSHPICMIHGDRDIVAPVSEAAAIAEGAGNVELHIMRDTGHAAFLTQDSQEVIRQWLR